MTTSPNDRRARRYDDDFGNVCHRVLAPVGRCGDDHHVRHRPIPACPTRWCRKPSSSRCRTCRTGALVYLLGSRYCETDKLSNIAWSLFGGTAPGWARVQAICDFTHERITFGYHHARPTRPRGTATTSARASAGLRASRGDAVPLHEHPGALLHRLSRRHRHPALGLADGFLRLVRSLPGRVRMAVVGIPSTRGTTSPVSAAS